LLFDHLRLNIGEKSFVCLVGTSGSGKTTLVDLLLALLPPLTGDILINGKSFHQMGEQSWRAMFGYVPQSIFIVDGTVAENIAFGEAPENVDLDWLHRVVALCHLEDFVDAQAEGLNAPVGERGSRLSGGQRQRLGIARALYRDPPILILDESTSSLDGISEKAIIQTLLELRKTKIVISIAHRDSLVRHCDRVILMDQGSVVADGSYAQLSGSSGLFLSLMAELGKVKQ
jgi:ABC-type bacteriocin/lantibiotic exporter with double-glycine peptidase domain